MVVCILALREPRHETKKTMTNLFLRKNAYQVSVWVGKPKGKPHSTKVLASETGAAFSYIDWRMSDDMLKRIRSAMKSAVSDEMPIYISCGIGEFSPWSHATKCIAYAHEIDDVDLLVSQLGGSQ